MGKGLPLGPVMLDVEGTALTTADRERLAHPLTGGVILFARNYAEPAQLARLTAEIHAVRHPPLIVAVDHEGGRVQRFREGFTAIPPMRALGRAWERDAHAAQRLAAELGYVLAAELRAHGVDLTFAPVLDVDAGASSVIGDRALHSDPEAVAELARALVKGFRLAGMSAVGKHFPGHGHVRADSHHEVPVDDRDWEAIAACDLVPFRRLVGAGIGGIMPAHVIFPRVDARPAGFSAVWLKRVLRGELGFGGVVFSDDLSMEGAAPAGGILGRAQAALGAGCDVVLVCNDPAAVGNLYSCLDYPTPPAALARMARLHGRAGAATMAALREEPRYMAAQAAIAAMVAPEGELPLA
ncbi:MAG: beta-N-acetylhexosaminidase [Burkholderiales bacterium]|nr:beta-N-acetylhexosaminidase [Burkholderiales bacterium]